MNKFIVKENHELKKLIKMNSNYIEKIVNAVKRISPKEAVMDNDY